LKAAWKKLNQATENVSDGLTADINTFALAYGTTWSSAAQNPANKPASGVVTLPAEASYVLLMFAIADTAGDECTAVLWGWDANGPAFDLLRFSQIQAGTSPVETDPTNGESLSNFFYADTLAISTDNTRGGEYDVTNTDNGIAVVKFDTFGIQYLFMDYDFDAASGTAGTDCITWYKIAP